MKLYCYFLLALITLVSTSDNNRQFHQIIDNFIQAISKGDQHFLDQNLHPTAQWSAPYQKLLRGRNEIIRHHQGITEGHTIQTNNLKFSSEGNLLQAFGYFDYLQENVKTHSGRFSATFEGNREGLYQLKNAIWNLDDSHLKKDCQQDDSDCQQ